MAVSAVLFFWAIFCLLLLLLGHKGAGVQSLTNGGQKIEVDRFGLVLEGAYWFAHGTKSYSCPSG